MRALILALAPTYWSMRTPTVKKLSLCLKFAFLLAAILPTVAYAQQPTPGQNVNMVPDDRYLQRQNESTIAVSTRNFLNIVGAGNDYRSVDVPYPDVSSDENNACPQGKKCAEPWVGIFKSHDGGQSWLSVLLPGYPQDQSPEGLASPLKHLGLTTASDPVVRAGTNGLFYYSGIAFNRGTNNGVVFVARLMDLNNKPNGDATNDSIRYVDTNVVASGTSTQFLDKDWIAVDVPRSSRTCSIQVPQNGKMVQQTIPAGNVYLVYTSITNPAPGVFNSQLYFTRSLDCGATGTWSPPVLISRGYAKSQGATIQIDPRTGFVYVAWRVFAVNNQPDAIVVAASLDGGHTFTPGFPVVTLPASPTTSFFDQPTIPDKNVMGPAFRTTAFPALAVGDSGIPFVPGPVYLAWSQRLAPSGDAKIMMLAVPGNAMISHSGITLPTPFPVDGGPLTDLYGVQLRDDAGNLLTRGHQFMPQMTISGGKLSVLYYDQREDHTVGFFTPNTPFLPDSLGQFYQQLRQREGELFDQSVPVFTPFLTDFGLTERRHTIAVRMAQANVSWNVPIFHYADVTQYTIGDLGTETGTIQHLQELQVNPPNLPLFQQGTAPFIGDYMDIAGLSFLKKGNSWIFNSGPGGNPVQYATWTSNQDVRAPKDGDWTNYTPVGSMGEQSTYDPGVPRPACQPGQAGMRNQNIYESRITQGLLLSSPQTSKPLSGTLERALVVTAENHTGVERSFHLTILAPAGVYASFLQVPNPPPSNPPAALTALDLTIPARSGIARSVFAFLTTSNNSAASITVNAVEITTPAGGIPTQPCTTCTVVFGGLTSFVILNPDGTEPPLVAPDGTTDDISIVEIYNSTLGNPNPSNPNPSNPNPSNPNPSNPNPSNPNPSNPNPSNPNPSNPNPSNLSPSSPNPSNATPATSAVANTDLSNPNPSNPNPSNTNLSDQPVSDATYTVTSTSDTSASYRVALVGKDPGHGLKLIVTRVYETPDVSSNVDGTPGCALITQSHTILQSHINNPVVNPNPSNADLSDAGITNGSDNNATFQLNPGQQAFITLRGFNVANDPNVWLQELSGTAPVIVSQAANTNTNTRSVTVPGGIFILTASLPDAVAGQPYSAPLTAIGGTGALNWGICSEVCGSLPNGFSINPTTGVISSNPDSPPTPGLYTFTVQVTDSAVPANTTSRQLSIRVAQPLAVGTASPLPNAMQGTSYGPVSFVTNGGGTPPFTWTPATIDGMSFNSSGVLSGTPSQTGSFTFIATVTDSASPAQTTSSAITVNVVPSTPAPPAGSTLLCDNFNAAVVMQQAGGPPNPTTCSLSAATKITQLATYHYNGGQGTAPGTISIRRQDGLTFGPFTATGVPGQGGANEAWVVTPNVIVPAGIYTIMDSGLPTWSYNSGSNNSGFVREWGFVVMAPTFTGTQTDPTQWTYTLTFPPLGNYSVFPVATQNTNLTTITLTGLFGVTSAAGPTSTDFPSGGSPDLNAVNLNWSAAVLNGGTQVVFTHVGPGTGNFNVPTHAFGFTISASGAVNGTAPLATSGFTRDTTNPLSDGTFNLDITDNTAGPVASSNACTAFPTGFVPFTTIFYIASDTAGDTFVVGGQSNVANGGIAAGLQNVPLPSLNNEQFCNPVTLETNYTVPAYVPTAAERGGDFSAYAGLTLFDPVNGVPFPSNMIPPSRLVALFAWRIPPHSPSLPRLSCSLEPTLHSIEGTVSTSIQFTNNTAGPVNVYWINYQGQRVFYRGGPFSPLAAGQSYVQETFITHPWIITDVATNRCLGIWLPTESSGTAVITGSAASPLPPQAPTGLSAAPQGSPPASPPSVALTWNASTSSSLAGYNVYRATMSAGPYTKLTSVPTTNLGFTDANVQSATIYYYFTTAVDTSGNESAYSNQVSVTTPAPLPSTALSFVTQPTNSIVGKPISPAVQVQAQDSTGALLPGVSVTLTIGNGVGPGGGSLFGTLTATTGVLGVASFSNLVVDNAGSGYTLLASANAVSATSNAFSLANPGIIDFENYPNGTPVLAGGGGVQITTAFSNFGVVFSGVAFLLDTAIYDPPNVPPNHAVEKTSGTMVMSFPGSPTSMQYQSTQNNSCNVPVQAVDAANTALAVSIVNSSTYTSTSGTLFRRETVVITNAGGIASVSLTDPICAVFVDNLALAFNAPLPPTALTATPVFTGPQPSVTLAWTASNSTVTTYNVYRAKNGAPYAKLASVAASTSGYSDNSVSFGDSLKYFVTAVDSTESLHSNEVLTGLI